MTQKEIAKELRIGRRTLCRYLADPTFPGVGTLDDMRRWVARHRGHGPATMADGREVEPSEPADWATRLKRSQALLNEQKLQELKEKYLQEKQAELFAEAEQFLGDLRLELQSLAIPPDVAQRLNEAIDRCLAKLGTPGTSTPA